MISLSIREIFRDSEGLADFHWELRVDSRPSASGAIYEFPCRQGLAALAERVAQELKGFGHEVAGSEEKNPLPTQGPEVKTQRTT